MQSKINWDNLIAEFESSGMSQNKFSKAKGVSLSTFSTHYKKYLISKKSDAMEVPEFMEMTLDVSSVPDEFNTVTTTVTQISSLPITIHRNDFRIDVPTDFSEAHLKKVLDVVASL